MEVVFNFFAIGAKIKFEDSNLTNIKQVGSTFEGKLFLEELNSSTFQLVLHEGHAIVAGNRKGEWRGGFSVLSGSENPNVRFQFTMDDILSEAKVLVYSTILGGVSDYIWCYDMGSCTGCWFRIDNQDEAKKLAKLLKIPEKLSFYEDGTICKVEEC